MASTVYFTDFNTHNGSRLTKLAALIKAAGFYDIDFERQYAAIKIHFGEPGNLAFLRPNYAKVVADAVKSKGGKPFLTDCNTMYVGRRKDAVSHLDAAYENGYSPLTTGCQIIIGDGLKGTDDVLIPINGELVKEAKIGRAIADADIIISMNHFKMHEETGIGGALKNLGMGCGSRAGKTEMHCDGKPQSGAKCRACGMCIKNCGQDAITMVEKKARIDHEKCVGCGRCIGICPFDAIHTADYSACDQLCKKISEYALAVVKDKPSFHINFVMDITPACDCHAGNDSPVAADIGMFASTDPTALDVACAEAVANAPILSGSVLDGKKLKSDLFKTMYPHTDWRVGPEHAEKIGLGSTKYELIKV